ncbi:MAG TPA: hypothetical protein VLZ74_08085 [Methylocella sp.]|nr:hypothetical protein [Methylocella sp.]
MTDAANAAGELQEKNKVIAHLTRTLAQTRECLEVARAAFERIAKEGSSEVCHEIALDTLKRI